MLIIYRFGSGGTLTGRTTQTIYVYPPGHGFLILAAFLFQPPNFGTTRG